MKAAKSATLSAAVNAAISATVRATTITTMLLLNFGLKNCMYLTSKNGFRSVFEQIYFSIQ
jgi:hypothetical protein